MFSIDAAKLAATQKLGKALLLGKKYSPEVLTVVGGVAIVTSVVLAVRATMKLEPIVSKHEEELEAARSLKEDIKEYPDDQYKIDVTRIYTKRVVDIVKLYAPPATLLIGGLACMVGANGILKKRNVAAIAAYKVVESQLMKYRENVIEDLGIEKDNEYRRGLTDQTFEDTETGKKITRKVVNVNKVSPYARFFDEGNINYNKFNPHGNLAFLRGQQMWANQYLHAHGHLFLNDVYKALGLEPTAEGQVVGWYMGNGDNYVDFGIYDAESEAARDFVNGYEKSILLDFNVDGMVYDLLKKQQRDS